jgi:hypothetical protein
MIAGLIAKASINLSFSPLCLSQEGCREVLPVLQALNKNICSLFHSYKLRVE